MPKNIVVQFRFASLRHRKSSLLVLLVLGVLASSALAGLGLRGPSAFSSARAASKRLLKALVPAATPRAALATVSEVEPNNTTAQADGAPVQLTGATDVTGSIGTVGDMDVFKLSLSQGRVIAFEVFDATGTDCLTIATTLRILDGGGVTIASANSGSGINACSALTWMLNAGTYYVRVEQSTNSATIPAYLLRVKFLTDLGSEVEPNDTSATATAFNSSDAYIFGNHQTVTDTDYYALTVADGTSLKLELIEGDQAVETCESNGVDSILTLFDANGTALGTDNDGGRGACSQIDGRGATPTNSFAHNLAAGTYSIRVTSPTPAQAPENQFIYRLVVQTLVIPPLSLLVDNTSDDGSKTACDSNVANDCSLRGALARANGSAGNDTISFDPTIFASAQTISLTNGELVVANNGRLTINGPGANLLTVQRSTAQGTPNFRLFTINANTEVNLNGLTITGGRTVDGPNGDAATRGGNGDNGGGIHNSGSLALSNVIVTGNRTGIGGQSSRAGGNGGDGGGIYNSGTLTVSNSALLNNVTGNGRDFGGNSGRGGGIYNSGALTVSNSTFEGNRTGNGGDNGGAGGDGAGIYNAGTLSAANSTFQGNFTGNGQGQNSSMSSNGGSGGGIYNANTLSLTNCTLSANSTGSAGNVIPGFGAAGNGGGIFNGNNASSSTIRNTIVALNTTAGTGPDLSGGFTSLGYNLIGDNSGATLTPTLGNKIGTSASPIDPRLGALASHGGPTQILRLLFGSPAIDAGDDCVADAAHCGDANLAQLTTDQRGAGFPRKFGAQVDIGAVEADYTLVATGGTPQSTIINSNFSTPLQATLTGFGGSVAGETISFTVQPAGNGASIAPSTTINVTTNGLGQANVTVAANTIAGGPYLVAASIGNLSDTFTLTNTCPGFAMSLPTATGTLGQTYHSSVVATPSVSAPLSYHYALANNTALPAGLTLDANTGAVSGTLNTPGNVSFDIQAQLFNSSTSTGCAVTQSFSINVTCVTNPVVTNTNDSGAGSLREAIATACPGSTITFGLPANLTITLTSGELALNKNLTIQGPGARLLTVSGNNASRVFLIPVGVTAIINDLTVTGGNGVGDNSGLGGGIRNWGSLTLNRSAVSGNTATFFGGGIQNLAGGTLTLHQSTISGNRTDSNGGGGGIENSGTLLVINSTISGNQANNSGGGSGGGIWTGGPVTLVNSTITGNAAAGPGSTGGLYRSGNAVVTLKNTIIAGNTSTSNTWADVRSSSSSGFNSQGYNLIGQNDSAETFFPPGNPNANQDRVGTSGSPLNALLTSLQNIGGPTDTHCPLPGSPAINAGNNCVLVDNGCGNNDPALITDQRGFNRQVGSAVDIGAFESRGFTLAVSSGDKQSTIAGTAFANPLTVTVTSASAEPVDGGQVVFTPPGVGASANIAGLPATIIAGTAITGTVTANEITGSYFVIASANGAAADVNFSLTNIPPNSAPTFTPATAISRQQGSPAGNATTIGMVNDLETAPGSLTITQVAGGTATGITVSNITNKGGTITAQISASCTAVEGTVRFQVSDGSLTGTGELMVSVTANAVPTIAYGNVTVAVGASTTNSPTTATDNGSITGYSVQPAKTFSGALSVDAAGLVSISNAAPVGTHTITIRATDNCNASSDASFTLTVTNSAPSITTQTGLTRQQGAAASNSQIATVKDSESGGKGVTVTVNGGPSATVNGVTVSGIANSGGTVTANIAATCGASNASFTLTATDGNGATATATLSIAVTGITVNPAKLLNGLTFAPYTETSSATGGTGSYTFSLASGSLPAGLTLNGNLIVGTPTTAGASTFTIRADDDANTCFGEQTYTINIGSTGLMYYPLARPVRLLDTRPGASPNACFQPNAPIAGGTSRLQPARGTCEGLNIPANATTITGHITTVQSGGGFLTLYPSDAPQPMVTNSNYLPNEILNNAFTVGLGASDGAFKLFVSSNTDVVIDVTGYYAPPSASGLYFHPLPKPIRLLETRTGFSGCQTPGAPLQTATTRTQTGVLTCDGVTIPTGALALVGNATTTNSTGSGYLTLWPADAVQPFASSSNFAAGINRNAPFTVGLSLNGEFNIYTARTTDLVIDVMGYYSTEANDANGQGLLFNSLGSPLRLLDTRAAQSACYQPGAPMTGGTVYTQETQIPCTNLTPTARGLVGNVSALNASANGYLTFWPSNAPQPTVATSNYQTGRVFNRHFTVGLGTDAAFKRFAASNTDVIIDISGFFAP